MVDKRLIPSNFQQKGNICLLASYSVVLGYYKHIERGANAQIKIQYLLEKYLDYMIEQSCQYNSQIMKEKINEIKQYKESPVGSREVENRIHNLLLCYCREIRQNIRGYLHIKEFDDFMRRNAFVGFPLSYNSNLIYMEEKPIKGVHERIISDLESDDNLAMILYNNHSIIIGRGSNDLIYLRDTNHKGIQEIHVENFTTEKFPITEYMLFYKIKTMSYEKFD